MLAHAIGHSGLALGPLFLSLLTRTYLGSFGLFPLGSFGFQHEDHYLISVLRCDNSSDRPSKPKSQEGKCHDYHDRKYLMNMLGRGMSDARELKLDRTSKRLFRKRKRLKVLF
ncbi:hypothetical protein BDR07DRAFT_178327 [Suillus spraguei]|nr:hypothetical protein BDR07DRAFT_178327 [Suillus spraguei]